MSAAPPPTNPRRLIRQSLGLLAAMTLAAFGGPVLIGAVLRGGPRRTWPPDRPIEWAVLLGVSALVLALMALCVAVALANQKAARRARALPQDRAGDPQVNG